MSYSQDVMKNEYRKKCKIQRKKNLLHLRENIAGCTLSSFAKEIGISKGCLSEIENGDRDLSMGNLFSYRTYFSDHFDLIVSIDYLLGYTDVIENQRMNIANDLGLSDNTISTLKELSKEKRDILNKLSEDQSLDFLLAETWRYAMGSTYVDIKISDHLTNSIETIHNKQEINSILKFRAIDSYGMILQRLKNSYRDTVSQIADEKIKTLESQIQNTNHLHKIEKN